MADQDLDSPEEVYPNVRWVPCTSNLIYQRSSGSPVEDGIEYLQTLFHPSKRWKYRSYPSVASTKHPIEDLISEMSLYSPVPLPKRKKNKKQIKKEERKRKLAEKIEQYRKERYNMPNATKKPENTLFVARLSYESTKETLLNEFSCFGMISDEDVKLITDRKNRSRGYAFIEFRVEDDLKNALAPPRRKIIDGREVLLDKERGRTEETWLPRRLGGGLGVKPKKASWKTRKLRCEKKKGKKKARKARVTGVLNVEVSCQKNPKVAVDISKQLDAVPIAGKGAQKISAGNASEISNSASEAAVEPGASTSRVADFSGPSAHLQPSSGNPPKNRKRNVRKQKKSTSGAAVQPSGPSTNNVADFSSAPVYLHPNHPDRQIASTGDQCSTALPQNYVEEIPAASGVQVLQSYQYPTPQFHRSRHRFHARSHRQQRASYNPYIVQENFNLPPVNYVQPVTYITYQPYSNFNYSSQNYQVQPPNFLTYQPENQNVCYSTANWQSYHYIPTLPQEDYQAPPTFYPVEPSVTQDSSQFYQNYSDEPENHHIEQFHYDTSYSVYENHYVHAEGNGALQNDYPTEQEELANYPPSNDYYMFNPYYSTY